MNARDWEKVIVPALRVLVRAGENNPDMVVGEYDEVFTAACTVQAYLLDEEDEIAAQLPESDTPDRAVVPAALTRQEWERWLACGAGNPETTVADLHRMFGKRLREEGFLDAPQAHRALAAAYLYGRPYAFTHEMVAVLRSILEVYESGFHTPIKREVELAAYTIDCLEALLPPAPPPLNIPLPRTPVRDSR